MQPFSTEYSSYESSNLSEDAKRIEQIIATAGELLPAQGPITAFVFLNPLQALEDIPFDEGLQKGSRLFGCEPYLAEEAYREKFRQERILLDDLKSELDADLGTRGREMIDGLATRYDIRLAMLEHPLRLGPNEELRWFIAETNALQIIRPEASPDARRRFLQDTKKWVLRDLRPGAIWDVNGKPKDRDERLYELIGDLPARIGDALIERWPDANWEKLALQSLWRISRDGARRAGNLKEVESGKVRHRDLLLEATGVDSDVLVHEVLIRFCASFADQGLATLRLPNREHGFFACFCEMHQEDAVLSDRWLHLLPAEIHRIVDSAMTPLESIIESLQMLGVPSSEWNDFLIATIVALKGWAGLIRQMEIRADRVPFGAAPGTMIEFVAVRLVLERMALTHCARIAFDRECPLDLLREVCLEAKPKRPTYTIEQRAFLVFQLAQVLGWSPMALYRLTVKEWKDLFEELVSFSNWERRRIFHRAFERNFRIRALDAFSIQARQASKRVSNPRFQAFFCIDAREESFRRHLEEAAPDVETFGAAGFYCAAMYYKGVADAHFSALCPIVVVPQHWVTEEVVYSLVETNRRLAKTRRALGRASHRLHTGSRDLAAGALLTAGFGVLASVPLVARVLFPRLTARIRKGAGQLVQPPPVTRLRIERYAEPPGPEGDHVGFSIDEMAVICERMLRDVGLIEQFARLVMFFGHGSACLNNPHKSAYDCGACSGSAGGPNARALAMMMNEPRVRKILAERGIQIPDTTVFLGGQHNTADDTVAFFDLDLLPRTHQSDFEAAYDTLVKGSKRNAHERCRRFQSAPLDITSDDAHEHVERRSEDLAQTRPEFGNASNAICFVGRRERIRGLYLDRRCFLHSYDQSIDDSEYNVLTRILGAVVPVCSGINLQYYFSYVDSPGWGCGTKLPHNITSLLGVMDGAASDLRSGLPWQGVEIHEPLRLLLVIESKPEPLLRTMERNPLVAKILINGWMQLALLDHDSSEILLFSEGNFVPYVPQVSELPKVESSLEWYRGWRDHLGFAQIEPQR
jgi:uncharacterized protein YbcC (UPF0753/DUF2309 family)